MAKKISPPYEGKYLILPSKIQPDSEKKAEDSSLMEAEKFRFLSAVSQHKNGLAALQSDLQNIEKTVSNLQKTVSEFYETDLENETTLTLIEQITSIENYIGKLQFSLGFLQNNWWDSVTKVVPDFSKPDQKNTVLNELNPVKFAVKNDELLLKMPMLPHLESSQKIAGYNGDYSIISTRLYDRSVQTAMQNALAGREEFRKKLTDKVIHYVFVYNEISYMIDSDSHDTRTITNAVAGSLPI